MPRTREEIISEMVDSGLFSDQEIKDAVGKTNAPDKYDKGFFKVYKGGAKTLPQKLDTAAGSASDVVLNFLKLPYDLTGEAITAPIEQRGFRAPSLLGGDNPADPIATLNKLLRAGAAGASTGNIDTARAAYNAPRGVMGPVEDTAMALLLGKVAPEVLTAPADAMAAATEKTLSGAKSLASGVVKKGIRTALGPTEEAQKVLFNRPQDVARQTNFNDLGDKVAATANDLSNKISELDNQAWDTLPPDKIISKDKLLSILKSVRQNFIGTGKTKIGDADKTAVKQIDSYIERIQDVQRPKEPTETFYHVTLAENIPDIKKNGLVAGEMGLSGQTFDNVYLSKSIDASKARAEAMAQYIDPNEIKILKIKLPKSITSSLQEDPEAMIPNIDFMYNGKIDPSYIFKGAGTSEAIRQSQLKEIIQSVQKDATYGLVKNEPVNRAVKAVRAGIDSYLKGENPTYAEAMKPVKEATAALEDTIKRFNLQKHATNPELGYVPTTTTLTKLKNLIAEKNPEVMRAVEQLKKTTGVDIADEAKLTAIKQMFQAGQKTNGSRRVMAGRAIGGGLSALLSLINGGSIGTDIAAAGGGGAIGGVIGAGADYYGGPMAKGIIDTLRKANSGVGNVLSAINNKAAGTPLEDVVRRLIAGEPALAPLLAGNQ